MVKYQTESSFSENFSSQNLKLKLKLNLNLSQCNKKTWQFNLQNVSIQNSLILFNEILLKKWLCIEEYCYLLSVLIDSQSFVEEQSKSKNLHRIISKWGISKFSIGKSTLKFEIHFQFAHEIRNNFLESENIEKIPDEAIVNSLSDFHDFHQLQPVGKRAQKNSLDVTFQQSGKRYISAPCFEFFSNNIDFNCAVFQSLLLSLFFSTKAMNIV